VKSPDTSNKGQAGDVDPVTEPRIIRGNDRVVAPAKPSQPIEGAPVSFSFEEAPVADVVRTILGDILKTDYVLHPPLSGTVTLSTRAPIPPDRAVFLLESALQANGLALMRDARGSYHVGRADALKGIGGAVRQAGSGPLPPGYGAIVVPLQYIGAAEMATILKPMMPADALVRVDNLRNLLVLTGTRTQAEGWLDLVNTFDAQGNVGRGFPTQACLHQRGGSRVAAGQRWRRLCTGWCSRDRHKQRNQRRCPGCRGGYWAGLSRGVQSTVWCPAHHAHRAAQQHFGGHPARSLPG
jgi:hypothetical protein